MRHIDDADLDQATREDRGCEDVLAGWRIENEPDGAWQSDGQWNPNLCQWDNEGRLFGCHRSTNQQTGAKGGRRPSPCLACIDCGKPRHEWRRWERPSGGRCQNCARKHKRHSAS